MAINAQGKGNEMLLYTKELVEDRQVGLCPVFRPTSEVTLPSVPHLGLKETSEHSHVCILTDSISLSAGCNVTE